MKWHKIPGRNLNWMVSGLCKVISGLLMILSLGFVYVSLDMDWTEFVVRREIARRQKAAGSSSNGRTREWHSRNPGSSPGDST